MAKKRKGLMDFISAMSTKSQFTLVVTVVVMAPILYVIVQNVGHSISVGSKIRALNRESKLYQEQIEKDSLLLEEIKYNEGLEKFARETYFMQRKGEKLFVIK